MLPTCIQEMEALSPMSLQIFGGEKITIKKKRIYSIVTQKLKIFWQKLLFHPD
jgi:hypothetical protein